MINKVILMGRLTRDPELRNTASGTSVCNFTVAVDDGYGENRTTSFISCVAWGRTAEFVNNYFSKGKMIIVIGRIQTRTWEGQDGRKNYSTEVVANEVSFGETKRSSEGGYDSQGGYGNQGGYSAPMPNPAAGNSAPDIPNLPDDFDDGGFTALVDTDDDLPF